MSTIAKCLTDIDCPLESLIACTGIKEEFSVIKKAFFKKVLVVHPDKGGDAAKFRRVHCAFEALKIIFENGAVSSFAASGERATSPTQDAAPYGDDAPPSWEYFSEAAQEEVPVYRVELAKSGRSRCAQKGNTARQCGAPPSDGGAPPAALDPSLIPKGAVRVGSVNLKAGTYGRWMHLGCWRVPKRVWLGLPRGPDLRDAAAVAAALLAMEEVRLQLIDTTEPPQPRTGHHNRQKTCSYNHCHPTNTTTTTTTLCLIMM